MTALRYCEHCGWWLRAGTEAEIWHGPRCQKAPRVQPWRQRYREALRAKLADRQSLIRLVVRARLKLHPEQLERVAEGKSDFSVTTWRRLAPYLE